ncbi:hypothetical protein ACFMJJ_16975, partial [Acinetobacter baumannii]
TEAGHDQLLAEYVVASGGIIHGDYYDGRLGSFTRSYALENCAIRFESAEYDSDSRSQVMTVSCPIDYNYFGSFANIGTNGSIQPGKKEIDGTAELVNRVQQVINTAQQAVRNSTINATSRTLGNLFG